MRTRSVIISPRLSSTEAFNPVPPMSIASVNGPSCFVDAFFFVVDDAVFCVVDDAVFFVVAVGVFFFAAGFAFVAIVGLLDQT
jgi:hypothetical protein